ncbi:MAG: extracellular solute-binding protein, partial [Nevskiales bacterium]
MQRRTLLKGAAGLGLLGPMALQAATTAQAPGFASAQSVDELPKLKGQLRIYLGHGEGGLYEDVISAIRDRNPDLDLRIRRAPSSALANTLLAEAKSGKIRADVFWSVDAAALAVVAAQGIAQPLPENLLQQINATFRYPRWAAISGRVRTLPFYSAKLSADQLPKSILELAERDLKIGWAPAYGAFQSFVAAMHLLEGEAATREWLKAIKPKARSYAGELGVVLAASRGEVDVGLANHYYTMRLKQGKPDANVELAFTHNDAGCLVNASGAAVFSQNETAINFIRYLLTREVQSYLAREAFELPLVRGVEGPQALPSMKVINPPRVDLSRLSELQP